MEWYGEGRLREMMGVKERQKEELREVARRSRSERKLFLIY